MAGVTFTTAEPCLTEGGVVVGVSPSGRVGRVGGVCPLGCADWTGATCPLGRAERAEGGADCTGEAVRPGEDAVPAVPRPDRTLGAVGAGWVGTVMRLSCCAGLGVIP